MGRNSIRSIQKLKDDGIPIVMMTAYDATSARLTEAAHIPIILVGDTLGMVVQGHTSTIPVTLEQMIYHASIVSRVTHTALIVGDLPFMTYSIHPEQAMATATRMMQEGGVGAVKLEGGQVMAPTIRRIVEAGIPVMAHIGLTPQSVATFGGFRMQGKEEHSALQLIEDALAVQEAGAFAVVLELLPTELTQIITRKLHIPTIGIGAGVHADGQVQVFHDVLGLFEGFIPKHTKRYTEVGEVITQALAQYAQEVRARQFPTDTHSANMNADLLAKLMRKIDEE
ncbi:MAG: 3-methyl-2-oxobutanoate hydroxymethyltransferase [Phototrophicaceae bacterium]